MVMPFAADQFFWADRLHRLGVAPQPLSPRRLDSRRLSAALAIAEHPDVHARATALGRRMATEDGVATGVAAVAQLLSQPTASCSAMPPSTSARSRSDP
jgi:UDP:flavonoid glycosyltransferase YjiC (YdhE family)